MRQSTRRRQLEQSQRGWAAAAQGPFGPVKVCAPTAEQLAYGGVSMSRADHAAELEHSGSTTDRSMMTAFFEYLHDHEATTDLAKILAEMAMLCANGARPVGIRVDRVRVAI